VPAASRLPAIALPSLQTEKGNHMNWERIWETVGTQLTAFGLKMAGAIAVWIVGRWLIGLAIRLLSGALTRQEVDPTLQRYIGNIVNVAPMCATWARRSSRNCLARYPPSQSALVRNAG
jgi:hypothetical protein